ncbi:MAG: 4'-phosphopantetheinyl transferase superfamily protein [Deltaproteobacteria bacterium]|nr:4'-phosphopantetheinyl transferase superfamily protein [Deltaproteobacteria bacterium]MCB9787033.1 4'-phosphopantetheinyl transferase superfamily protein [Deltaproteobacteria bacterium]
MLSSEARLGHEEVHLIAWATPGSPERMDAWRGLLSADEAERAARFRFARHARAWEAARGGLRELLGRYAGGSPQALRFTLGPHGKPALEGSGAPDFNLSHTEGLALLAIGRGGALGVDVEARREVPERAGIARSHFSDAEVALLEAEDAEGRGADCFLRLWTRKEAVIKAVGQGLGYPLRRVTVGLASALDGPIFEPGAPGAEGPWSLEDLDPGPGFRAALACRFRPGAVRLFRWR